MDVSRSDFFVGRPDRDARHRRTEAMRATYDPAADALYIHVGDGRVAGTREVAPGVNLDETETGELVGIEILGAAARPGSNRMAIAFEILGRELAA
jgi:uncharacterized protein YuzE